MVKSYTSYQENCSMCVISHLIFFNTLWVICYYYLTWRYKAWGQRQSNPCKTVQWSWRSVLADSTGNNCTTLPKHLLNKTVWRFDVFYHFTFISPIKGNFFIKQKTTMLLWPIVSWTSAFSSFLSHCPAVVHLLAFLPSQGSRLLKIRIVPLFLVPRIAHMLGT